MNQHLDPSAAHGALSGLRVVDLTGDTGRFATKLLAELGADVVRVGTGSPGLPLADRAAAALGGVADWWYDGGKRRCRLDLSTDEGRDAYRQLTAAADLVIETERPGRLAQLGIDYPDASAENPALVQVSITPFGRTGPRALWLGSDLVSAAMGGMMALTGLADRPLNVWGRPGIQLRRVRGSDRRCRGSVVGALDWAWRARRPVCPRDGHRLDREPVHAVLLRRAVPA